jgi:hypothetical protein
MKHVKTYIYLSYLIVGAREGLGTGVRVGAAEGRLPPLVTPILLVTSSTSIINSESSDGLNSTPLIDSQTLFDFIPALLKNRIDLIRLGTQI